MSSLPNGIDAFQIQVVALLTPLLAIAPHFSPFAGVASLGNATLLSFLFNCHHCAGRTEYPAESALLEAADFRRLPFGPGFDVETAIPLS